MNITTAFVAVLLFVAVLVEVLACIGLATMRTTMQRLHFVGPATCVGPVLAGVAVVIGTHATADQAGKGLLIALILALFSGVLSHETGRAAFAREAEKR